MRAVEHVTPVVATAPEEGSERWPVGRPWWRDSLRRRMLAGADATVAIVFSVAFGILSAGGVVAAFWAATLLPVWIVLAKLHGLYDRDHRALRHLTADELPSLFLWVVTSGALTIIVVARISGHSVVSLRVVLAFGVACLAAACFRSAARFAWRNVVPRDRTVIIGEGSLADAARRKLELFHEIHAQPVGAMSLASARDLEERRAELRALHPDRLLLAALSFDDDLLGELISFCRQASVKLTVVLAGRRQFGAAVQLGRIAELPVLEYNTADVSRSTLLLKRLGDVVLASVLLVVLAPLFALAALATLVESGPPVFFKQVRAGISGRPFTMWKFRTMVRGAEAQLRGLVPFEELDEPVFKLRRDPRVTRVGRIVRRFSIDELPQLFNVLRGDMSLVGPRPEQADLVALYRPEHLVRLQVKPGLTGPMQVFGRGELSLEERIAVEQDYIENLTLARDLRILAMTIAPVVSGRGAF
ncbi:MAG: hypothetical protein V7644_2629 [Actinomycetota bacterium]